jgi:hypothetical protein
MSFDMSDYVDVAERIRVFHEKYPEGSLQSDLSLNREPLGWLCKARAFRTPTDERPGVGHAFEPIPGKTPYTKDSEAMNAETSAWGRAIVALGFETKKIASANEVRARSAGAGGTDGQSPAPAELSPIPEDAAPSQYVVHFGKNRGVRMGSLTPPQLRWYAETWVVQEDPSDYDRRLKAAAVALHSGDDTPLVPAGVLSPHDDEIPFG